MKKVLSLSDTNVLKGIALLLLLFHHCFEPGRSYADIYIGEVGIVAELAAFCKLCVVIFVFLSGYGLTFSVEKQGGVLDIFQFYRKRYVKLMMNYWLIWILFVPLGVFVIGRTFQEVYVHHVLAKSFLDFFGLYYAATGDYWGYNATWWFYGCIIMLYLMFPLLYKLRTQPIWLLPLTFVFTWQAWRLPFIHACANYLLAFVVGMLMAKQGFTPPLHVNKCKKLAYILCFLVVCLYRRYSQHALWWDVAIMLAGCHLYLWLQLPKLFSIVLAFLGKHSFNIFLFHTFLYAYYFEQWIYWSSNPILIYLTLLFSCLAISIVIEWLKEKLGVKRLESVLIGS